MKTSEAEKIVPTGFYCYTKNSFLVSVYKGKVRKKPCPLYVYRLGMGGYCTFMQEEVEDEVKICSINE